MTLPDSGEDVVQGIHSVRAEKKFVQRLPRPSFFLYFIRLCGARMETCGLKRESGESPEQYPLL